jgi:hypothetical protein
LPLSIVDELVLAIALHNRSRVTRKHAFGIASTHELLSGLLVPMPRTSAVIARCGDAERDGGVACACALLPMCDTLPPKPRSTRRDFCSVPRIGESTAPPGARD